MLDLDSLDPQGVLGGAFAELSATAGRESAAAVDAIKRFLVPFDCWSMLDYGLYGEENEIGRLSIIDDREKAEALLSLLDLTIGTTDNSVVPRDLADALNQIRKIEPKLANNRAFRRLATAARL